MLEIYDTCNIGVGPEPSGGLTIVVKDIEGKPGVQVMVPVTKDAATELIKGMQQIVGAVETFDLATLNKLKGEAGA